MATLLNQNYSIVTYRYDGTGPLQFETNFALGILDVEHVQVYVLGDLNGAGEQNFLDFSYDYPTGVVTVTEPIVIPAGVPSVTVVLSRTVPKEELYISFAGGADISKTNIDKILRYTIMAVHEVHDGRLKFAAIEELVTLAMQLVQTAQVYADEAEVHANAAELSRLAAEAAQAAAIAARDAAQAAANVAVASGTPHYANAAALATASIPSSVSCVIVGNKVYTLDNTNGSIASADGKRWTMLDFSGQYARMVADMQHGTAVRITAYGDSTTDGNGTTGWTQNPVGGSNNAIGGAAHVPPNAWPQVAQNALRTMFGNAGITVHNAGYSGQQLQTGWAYNNFQNAVLGPYPAPRAVVVSFGINDVRQPYFSPDDFEMQLLLLCRRIARNGAFPIFLLPDEPSDERHSGWKLGKVREVYKSVSARIGVQIIDWGTALNDLSQCSDGTSWRWGADQPDDTHGNDALHSVKGGFIAASIYPHTLWVKEPITDIAPWSRYCKPIAGYSVYQGTMNKFGGAMIAPAGSYATDQSLLDMWVWSVGAARNMYWAAVDANNYLSPRTTANAPLIGMYDYTSKTTQTIVAPASASAAGPDGGRDGEAMGRVFRVPQGLSRWAFRAPRDNNSTDVYLGYFSIREVRPVFSIAHPVFTTVAASTIIDRDPEGDVPQVFGFQHGRTLSLALEVDLPAGMGVCLWSSRVYGGSVTRENNRKRGIFLFRHQTDNRLFLYSVLFNADGSVGTSTSLGSSAVLTWAGKRQLRITGGIEGNNQVIRVFDGWTSNVAEITATNALTTAPLPWGGTPGAVWQFPGSTGVVGATIYGDV